jgi:hypothetical protein
LLVSSLILFGVFVILSESFVGAQEEVYRPTRRSRAPRRGTSRARRMRADVNSVFGTVESLTDPNAIRTKLKELKDIEKALKEVSRQSGKKEQGAWIRGTIEDRIDLAIAVEKQVVAELNLVRKAGAEEGAQKTTAAIDGILLDRRERFGKLLAKMDTEMRKMYRGERDFRRGRGRTRGLRDRYPEEGREQQMYRDDEAYRDREWEDRRTRRR